MTQPAASTFRLACVLAGTADEAVTAPLTETTVSETEDSEVKVSFGINIWDPQMVEYACAE